MHAHLHVKAWDQVVSSSSLAFIDNKRKQNGVRRRLKQLKLRQIGWNNFKQRLTSRFWVRCNWILLLQRSYRHITLMLEKQHNIIMNQRTLKRRLKDYGLKRRETVDEELKERVRDLIVQEICTGPDSLSGYRTMWHVLRLRHRINVPWWLVESLFREVDPRGVEHRKSRCLQRRTYVSPGPNFCWHMDGYDKLKPYGFSIHGCVDGFSRRILWLEVQRSNKIPRCVASYFFKARQSSTWMPSACLHWP